jgi:hypothetical protein
MKKRVKRGFPIKLIALNDIDNEIDSSPKPVLILCIRKDYEFTSQMELLNDLLGGADGEFPLELKVCLVDEESRLALKARLDLQGSPAFLLFEKGKEKGRLLGVADKERLGGFLSNSLGWSL